MKREQLSLLFSVDKPKLRELPLMSIQPKYNPELKHRLSQFKEVHPSQK